MPPWFLIMFVSWGIAVAGSLYEWSRLRGVQRGRLHHPEHGFVLVRGDIATVRTDGMVPRHGRSTHAAFGVLDAATVWFVRRGFGAIRLGPGLVGAVTIRNGAASYEARLGFGLAAFALGMLSFVLIASIVAWSVSSLPAIFAGAAFVWFGVSLRSEMRASRLIAAEVLRVLETAG